MAGARVLLARAAIARDVIPDALRQAGAQVDVVDAYRNGILRLGRLSNCDEALAEGLDAATFTEFVERDAARRPRHWLPDWSGPSLALRLFRLALSPAGLYAKRAGNR